MRGEGGKHLGTTQPSCAILTYRKLPRDRGLCCAFRMLSTISRSLPLDARASPALTTEDVSRRCQMSQWVGVRLPDLAMHIPKRLFIVYLKFEFNCVTCVLSGNPTWEAKLSFLLPPKSPWVRGTPQSPVANIPVFLLDFLQPSQHVPPSCPDRPLQGWEFSSPNKPGSAAVTIAPLPEQPSHQVQEAGRLNVASLSSPDSFPGSLCRPTSPCLLPQLRGQSRPSQEAGKQRS